MVTYKLIEETDECLVFWYYPEGHESKKPGIIIVDRASGRITITELAEDDWERIIPAEELNELAEAINQMKREQGDTDFVEMTTKSERYIFYGDHAIRGIAEQLREGTIPKNGMRAWY